MEDEEKEVEGIQEKINWFTTFLLSLIDIPEKMRKKRSYRIHNGTPLHIHVTRRGSFIWRTVQVCLTWSVIVLYTACSSRLKVGPVLEMNQSLNLYLINDVKDIVVFLA